MKQEYRQETGNATESVPVVPDVVDADTSEVKEALDIILGDALPAATGKRKARARPYSLTERAHIFRKRLERIESEMEASNEP